MSQESRARIEELQTLIADERTKVHALGDNITRAQENAASERISDLMTQLSTAIVDGAKPCPKCGATPHGMVHPMAFKGGAVRSIYEVGCLPCPDVRSIDLLPELAVERFNAGKFEPKSDGPGVRLAGEGKLAE